MKSSPLLPALFITFALTGCGWFKKNGSSNNNAGDGQGTDKDRPSVRPGPGKPVPVPPRLKPGALVLPDTARLYHFNPFFTPDVSFLDDDGDLPDDARYETGEELDAGKVRALTSSLSSSEPPGPVYFRPRDAVVYFGTNKKPVYCVEISKSPLIVRGVDPATGIRIQLKDKRAALDLIK